MSFKFFKSRTASVVLATGLAMGVMATPAFADSMSTDDYVTAAARRAAMPAPEILGLSGVEESGTWLDLNNLPGSLLSWSSPKYYLFGSPEYSTNPNPFMYNFLNDYNGTSKKIVLTDWVGSPNTSLPAYNSTDNAALHEVWNMMPDVIIGNQNKVDYDSAEYAGAAGAANGNPDYHPLSTEYSMSTYKSLINTMYDIAALGDQAATNTGKHLRYGDATDIAKQYEQYVIGTQGYILMQLDADQAQKKTVALVTDYDEASGTYTLMKSNTQDGTAASNRYLETCQAVSNMLDDTYGTTVTADQLAEADLVMIGSQRGSTHTDSQLYSSLPSNIKDKTYYTTDSNVGSLYGVTMNSVENAQNFGRILGCLYPEYIDQDDFVCYYFENFYHLKDGVALGTVIDNSLDGVVNWDSTGDRTQWTVADARTYNRDDVQAKLDRGVAYVSSLGEQAPAVMTPTEHVAGTIDMPAAVENGVVTVSAIGDQAYTGQAITPDVTVSYNGQALTQGTEYTVEYANNTEPGTATVTITGKGGFTGTMTLTFEISTATTRVAGEEAGQTALAISKQTFVDGECGTVVLARDDDFADSMSATGLAGALNCPILLIDREQGVTDDVKAEIARLGAKRVIVVGGTGAIPADVENQLSDLTVSRVFGETASDTSVKCADAIMGVDKATPAYVVVAMSDNFQDALSMSSFAYKYHAPIILETAGETAADRQLPEGALDMINGVRQKVFVAGGTGALSDASLSGVTAEKVRLWGEDGFDTSNQIATYMVKEGLLSAETVTVASGAESAKGLDALAGAALAGKNGGVVLLANGHETDDLGALDYTTIDAVDSQGIDGFLASHAGVKQVYVLGGTYVMPDEFVADVTAAADKAQAK